MFQTLPGTRDTAMNKTKMSHFSKSLYLLVSVYLWRQEDRLGEEVNVGNYERKIPDSDNCWVEK